MQYIYERAAAPMSEVFQYISERAAAPISKAIKYISEKAAAPMSKAFQLISEKAAGPISIGLPYQRAAGLCQRHSISNLRQRPDLYPSKILLQPLGRPPLS